MASTTKAPVRPDQQELLKRALRTIPPGLPSFHDAWDQRIGDAVDQFVQSFYSSGITRDFPTAPSAYTNDARKDDKAIEAHFKAAIEAGDLERAADAFGALSDHIGDLMSAYEHGFYYLGMAVGLRASQSPLGVVGLIPLPSDSEEEQVSR
jgi:hypothetical protein